MPTVDLAADLDVAMSAPGGARLLQLADRQDFAAQRAALATAPVDNPDDAILLLLVDGAHAAGYADVAAPASIPSRGFQQIIASGISSATD
jgi:hypothetical protein